MFADGFPVSNETLTLKCNTDGQMDWQKMKTRADANTNWAMLIPKEVENFPVQTSWGDTLLANRPGIEHGLGDFLVCADNGYGQPNLNDVWVVNGAVFPTTYDLHAFPNMFSQEVTTASTPYPTKNFVRSNIANGVFNNESDNSKSDKFMEMAKEVASNLATYYGQSIGANIQNAELNFKKSGLEGNYIMNHDYNYWRYRYNVMYTNGSSIVITITAMTESGNQEVDPYISIEADNGLVKTSLRKMCSASAPCYEKGKNYSKLTGEDYGVVVNRLQGKEVQNTGIQGVQNNRTSNNHKKPKSIFGLFKR